MSIGHSVPAVGVIHGRLRALLEKASRVKPEANVDPPLPLSEFEEDIREVGIVKDVRSLGDALEGQTQEEGDAVYMTDYPIPNAPVHPIPTPAAQHTALETAARFIFNSLLASSNTDPSAFSTICNLLDLLQFAANASQCDASLPLWLVEELLDSQTIAGCKRVFDFLESRRERMITDTSPKAKQLIVLRTCNELLRRLSRAEDAVFCGRVYMFLFQSFPLGDKSSVNLRGEFHVENLTGFDAPKEVDGMDVDVDDKQVDTKVEVQAEKLQVGQDAQAAAKETQEIVKGDAKAEEEPTIDADTLYSMFWSLQHVFSNPTKVFVPEEFERFKNGLEATIKKFKAVTKVVQTRGSSRTSGEGKRGIKRKRNGEQDEFGSTFNSKYLTSRDLFELEV